MLSVCNRTDHLSAFLSRDFAGAIAEQWVRAGQNSAATPRAQGRAALLALDGPERGRTRVAVRPDLPISRVRRLHQGQCVKRRALPWLLAWPHTYHSKSVMLINGVDKNRYRSSSRVTAYQWAARSRCRRTPTLNASSSSSSSRWPCSSWTPAAASRPPRVSTRAWTSWVVSWPLTGRCSGGWYLFILKSLSWSICSRFSLLTCNDAFACQGFTQSGRTRTTPRTRNGSSRCCSTWPTAPWRCDLSTNSTTDTTTTRICWRGNSCQRDSTHVSLFSIQLLDLN